MKVVLASGNAGKVTEVRRILTGLGVDVELVGLADVPPYDEPPETGATFADNALLKALAAVAATGLPAIADDSGLVVDALNGMPGVLSARWAGGHGDDAANVKLVLAQLADVPDERRGGGFSCAAVFATPDGTKLVAEATWRGTIARKPLGDNGFGYDPIFIPIGESRTSAQLSAAEKDAVSHRGQALAKLARLLRGDAQGQGDGGT